MVRLLGWPLWLVRDTGQLYLNAAAPCFLGVRVRFRELLHLGALLEVIPGQACKFGSTIP